ncbi:IS5 family transposase [Streptomyces sp. SID2888]|uniref:IS5 family transposase n=1 Tax=Streptomyces sp. SID2888 TaxID=2690256 RepID=UPI001EFFEE1A|nr:IS5 family transposase [Streptomyces sp. SID2888]
MTRGDLTVDEWAVFEPLLPLGERGPIPDLRRLVNGVMWRFRTGGPWRDVPERYGPWSTVYGRFHIWAKAGVFQTLMEAVIAEAAARGQVDLDLVSVDSTVARAHHHAAGMAADAELLEALEKAVAEEKGLHQRGKTPQSSRTSGQTPPARSSDACADAARPGSAPPNWDAHAAG